MSAMTQRSSPTLIIRMQPASGMHSGYAALWLWRLPAHHRVWVPLGGMACPMMFWDLDGQPMLEPAALQRLRPRQPIAAHCIGNRYPP